MSRASVIRHYMREGIVVRGKRVYGAAAKSALESQFPSKRAQAAKYKGRLYLKRKRRDGVTYYVIATKPKRRKR